MTVQGVGRLLLKMEFLAYNLCDSKDFKLFPPPNVTAKPLG
jgi:hypothetical protein